MGALRAIETRAAAEHDASTIEACRRGDPAALQGVFRRHSPALERLLGRILGPSADVEDVLQDVFEAAIGAFPKYRGNAPVASWLCGIAVRRAYHHLRRPDRKRRVPLEVVADADDQEPALEHVADSRSLLEWVYRELARSSPKNRIAFVLHVIEARPIDEVAALMSATKAATKSRVFFCRRRLLERARRDAQASELVAALRSKVMP
jgi:RNA polymerase sigma-70 factor (ECF subfamily)